MTWNATIPVKDGKLDFENATQAGKFPGTSITIGGWENGEASRSVSITANGVSANSTAYPEAKD